MAKRTPPADKKPDCPISREEFERNAKPLVIDIDGNKIVLSPKLDFSTGSFGWSANGKVVVTVNGTPLKCQLGLNLTVVGSKHVK